MAEKMHESPHSLQYICITVVRDKIEFFSQLYREGRGEHKNQLVFLHTRLSELLLSALNEGDKLTDQSLEIFSNKEMTRLVSVRLTNSKALSMQGLRHLLAHNISQLEIFGSRLPVCDIINGLSEWSLQNLKVFGVSGCMFVEPHKNLSVVLLSKLRNIRVLDVSNTELNDYGLGIISEDLPCLEVLDISETKVSSIAQLARHGDRLVALSLYNLQLVSSTMQVLLKLARLKHLDVSTDSSSRANEQTFPRLGEVTSLFSAQEIFQNPNCLPQLESLDISGCVDISVEALNLFIKRHRNLEFLGLFSSALCFEEMFTDSSHWDFTPRLAVAGVADEKQVFESLRRYQRNCQRIQRSLYDLFSLTQFFEKPRVDAIQLVLQSVKSHPQHFPIQMAATACLYNLTKGELGQQIHPRILKDVVHYTLTAMENYPNNLQLQKNTLLTLCSDRILQDVSFDRYRCARLVLDCLCTFDDESMGRMSVAICSILAAKISTAETSMLGSKPRYMKKLLELVKNKMNPPQADIILKFTLSALWNLTDESPNTCSVFLHENGLTLFLDVLVAFAGEHTVETKVLGLLNNIAEVSGLRSHLMVDSFLVLLRNLLSSPLIDVSYFAAGIVAHLASGGPAAWTSQSVTRQEMLHELGNVVLSWESPDGEMVAYRSFYPFFDLLKCYEAHQVQLWALWAIQHVCSKNAKRYCAMLSNEGGSVILKSIISHSGTQADVREFCRSILELLEKESLWRGPKTS